MDRLNRHPSPSTRDEGRGRSQSGGGGKGLLKERLELEKIKTKEGRTRWTVKPISDVLTFDKGFYVFIRALQLLKSHNEGVVLVGLGGASGSGKTAFSEKVKTFLPGIAVISMDNYNDASKLVDGNFDDPRLTDYELLLQNLADLKAGRPTELPVYSFKESRRVGTTTQPVPPSRVVIIEGIYALSERLKPLLDLRVSITGGVHFDLVKRVLRDIGRSGQGPEEIIQQITDTVYPMYKAWIEPDLQSAQLRIHNTFNPFTGFMNATYILKAARKSDMTPARAKEALGPTARDSREAEMYDIYLLPPGEDSETCTCWLRMRNRDGKYSLMFEEWVSEGPFIISPRIAFEVSVRVLGGLMALGYEIGTIMKRTSVLFEADGEVTIKFDDVEGLGQYVQVQGKDRDTVQAMATKLGLESTDFIPNSYIEQVQLEKLTHASEFQALPDDVRQRFSINGDIGGSGLDDYLPGSSPLRPSFLPHSQTFHTARSPTPDPSAHLLSTSAPIAIHLPPKHMGSSAAASSSSSGGSMDRSTGRGGGRGVAAGRGTGLLGQQLRGSSTNVKGLVDAEHGGLSDNGLEGRAGEERKGIDARAGSSERAESNGTRHARERHAHAGSGGSHREVVHGNGHREGAVLAKVQEQLGVLGEHVHRYSGLSLQMDAMLHQYRAMNEHMGALAEATGKLQAAAEAQAAAQQAVLQALAHQQQQGQQGPVAGSTLLGVTAVAALVVGALLGVMAARHGKSS